MTLTAVSVESDPIDDISTEQQAFGLLVRMRDTPMRRGALSKRARALRGAIGSAIASQGVSGTLANRIAFQLAFKFHPRELHAHGVWEAIGAIVHRDAVCLKDRVGLVDRKIVSVLPKLSAPQVQQLLEELTTADRRIARTILNAAIDAADPVIAARRYLAEYRLVARQLRAIDPTIARTLANATFTAVMPLDKALTHARRFLSLIKSAGEGVSHEG